MTLSSKVKEPSPCRRITRSLSSAMGLNIPMITDNIYKTLLTKRLRRYKSRNISVKKAKEDNTCIPTSATSPLHSKSQCCNGCKKLRVCCVCSSANVEYMSASSSSSSIQFLMTPVILTQTTSEINDCVDALSMLPLPHQSRPVPRLNGVNNEEDKDMNTAQLSLCSSMRGDDIENVPPSSTNYITSGYVENFFSVDDDKDNVVWTPSTWGLPEEIILIIFSFLTRRRLAACAQVCREWRRLAYSQHDVWKKVALNHQTVSINLLLQILLRGPLFLGLRAACVLDFHEPSDAPWSKDYERTDYTNAMQTAVWSRRTIAVNCVQCEMSGMALRRLTIACPFIRRLNLSGMPGLCNDDIKVIADTLPGLTGIKMTSCLNVTADCLCYTLPHWNKLTSLSIGWMVGLNDTHVPMICDNCPDLRVLDLCGAKITDISIERVAKACPKLHTLELSDCYELSDESSTNIRVHCSNIRHVDVSRCRLLTTAEIIELAFHLIRINVFGSVESLVPSLRQQYPKLIINDVAVRHFSYMDVDHDPTKWLSASVLPPQ